MFLQNLVDFQMQSIYSLTCILIYTDQRTESRGDEVDMKNDEVPKIVRELRMKMALTQEQFAAEVGVTFATVNRWESGKAKPSPLAARRIRELRTRYEID